MDTQTTKTDPTHHTRLIKGQFSELITHLRDDVSKVEDPKVKALFEVSAEVLTALQKAFTDYEEKKEDAWR